MTVVLKRRYQSLIMCMEGKPSEDIGSRWPSRSPGEKTGTDPSLEVLIRSPANILIFDF